MDWQRYGIWIPKGLTMEPLKRTYHDTATGETWQKELTAEELADLEQIPQAKDDLA